MENLPDPTPQSPAAVPKVVASIPRRKQVESHQQVETVSYQKKEKFKATSVTIAKRMVVWTRSLGIFAIKGAWDAVRLKSSQEKNAVRLREAMQSMGPTTIKLGQQLSIRADLLPTAYCNELRKLLDRVPAFPTEEAIKIIEAETGRKMDQIFSKFDPTPIGAASISCVFQAFLLDGTKVAVKVRRPGIGEQMAADLRALTELFQLVEWFGITRPGLSKLAMRELERMLMDELDFRLEARYTEIFRQDAKKMKYLSAPKVFFEYSGGRIIVSEFVSGVFLSEILRAVDARDEVTLAKFRARGFDEVTISKRMMRVFFWEVFESHFFHADPHPANIIIQPDNTITMIDFGSCGEISRSYRRDMMNFYRHLEQGDLNGVTRSMISSLEPLPPVDIEAYSNDLLAIVRESFIAIQSEHASWEEKCSGGMWMKLINLHHQYEIPTRPDVLRFFRASFLYDSIIYRLNPKFDQIKEFRRWYLKWADKAAVRFQNKMRERLFGPTNTDYLQLESILSLAEQSTEKMQRFLKGPDYDYANRVNKFAYVVSMITKSTVQAVFFILAVAVARFAYDVVFHKAEIFKVGSFAFSMRWVLLHPMVHITLVGATLVVIRKILMRLDDVDVD